MAPCFLHPPSLVSPPRVSLSLSSLSPLSPLSPGPPPRVGFLHLARVIPHCHLPPWRLCTARSWLPRFGTPSLSPLALWMRDVLFFIRRCCYHPPFVFFRPSFSCPEWPRQGLGMALVGFRTPLHSQRGDWRIASPEMRERGFAKNVLASRWSWLLQW